MERNSTITSLEELEALYGVPAEASIVKEVERVTPHYQAFIEASPFAVLATSGPEGLDCSPRGDRPGFVRVATRVRCCCPIGAATTAWTHSETSCAILESRSCS